MWLTVVSRTARLVRLLVRQTVVAVVGVTMFSLVLMAHLVVVGVTVARAVLVLAARATQAVLRRQVSTVLAVVVLVE